MLTKLYNRLIAIMLIKYAEYHLSKVMKHWNSMVSGISNKKDISSKTEYVVEHTLINKKPK